MSKDSCIDFGKITDQAYNILCSAAWEANQRDFNTIGSVEILLGLLAPYRMLQGFNGETESIALKVLNEFGITYSKAKNKVLETIEYGNNTILPQVDFISLFNKEAYNLGDEFIRPEHLLLGLLKEEEGLASKVIVNLGIDLLIVRSEVFKKIKKSDPDLKLQAKKGNISLNFKNKKKKKEQSDKKIDNRRDNDLVSQLERLASLREKGLLTEEEYVEAKRKLIF